MQEWKKRNGEFIVADFDLEKIICNNSYFNKAIGSSTEGFKNSFAYKQANANDLCKYAFGLVTFWQ